MTDTVQHYLCNPFPAMPAEQDRIAELTRERDEAREQLETVSVNYDLAQGGWHSDHERMVQMREQLADVTRERDEVRHQLETWLEIDKGIREIFSYEQDEMIDLTTFVAQDVGELRHQLATVQAEAASLRAVFDKRWSFGADYFRQPQVFITFDTGDGADKCYNAIRDFIDGTAGRELLDAHAKEIAEREKKIAQQKTSLREMHAGCETYRHTIKRLRDRNAENDERIAELTRERDELRRRAGSTQSIGVDFGLACGRFYLSVCGHVVAVEGDTQRDVQLSRQFGPAWNKEAIDYVVATAKEQDKALAQSREQLATVQAEAAAMRENVHEVVKEFRKLEAMEGNEPIRCSRMHFGDWADRLLEPTGGRELLDELRRKDERIKQLEEQLDTTKRYWSQETRDLARLARKCRTAKSDLIEARAKLDSRRWRRVAAELSLRLDGCDLSAVGHSDVSIGTQDTSDEKGGE